MINSRALISGALYLCLSASSAIAQDLALWDFSRMRDSRECGMQSKMNFAKLMLYQAAENRKIDSMNLTPAQKRQLGYEVSVIVRERNQNEEEMERRCVEYFDKRQ